MTRTPLQPSSHTWQLLLLLLLLLCLLLAPGLAAEQADFAGKVPTDILWQLNYTDRYTNRSVHLGGQNLTTCCIQAVKDSLEVVDGHFSLVDGHEGWIMIPNNASYDYPLDMLYEYSNRGQFPCTATYDGDPYGAPVVSVNYTWMNANCSGWQLSSTDNLNSWLQPLSGFLVPAVIFCMSVPRRRKIEVPPSLFAADQAGIMNYLLAPLGAMAALVMVSADTILWLCTCLAFSGPMIVSGLYEAMLDNRVLEYLRLKISERKLTLDMRCRCLMVILIGNLDLVWNTDVEGGSGGYIDSSQLDVTDGANSPDGLTGERERLHLHLHQHSDSGEEPLFGPLRQQPSPHAAWEGIHLSPLGLPTIPTSTVPGVHVTPPEPSESDAPPASSPAVGAPLMRQASGESTVASSFGSMETDQAAHSSSDRDRDDPLLASPWLHMEEFLYSLRLYDDDIPSRGHSPRQYKKHLPPCDQGIHCHDYTHYEQPMRRTPATENEIAQMKTRLKTMLHCQYSFGSVIGAPVIFFLGGFIFTFLQSLATLGAEDIAIGLAFGQWFMIIPHIAIISGLLLAGNNPNILEGVLAVNRKYHHDDLKIFGLTYGLAYPSCYKVAWLWNRGHNKKQWLNTLIDTYLERRDDDYRGNIDSDEDILALQKTTTLSLRDWIGLLFLTMALLGIPYVLAFLTAYYTPEIGLSCRTLTFTVYTCVQTGQIILWMWAYAGPLASFDVDSRPAVFHRGGWLARRGFYRPYSTRWLRKDGGPPPHSPLRLLQLITQNPRRLLCWPFLWNVVYYTSQLVLGLIGIMAAIGGTLMQLLGVYSAAICYITTPYWFKALEDRPMAIISLNSQEMITQSNHTWKPCAIAAIFFMGIVSFIGWWYQRRMRDLFTDQVSRIDKNERADTLQSRPDRGRVLHQVPSAMTFRTLDRTPSATRSRAMSQDLSTSPVGSYFRARSSTLGTIDQMG